MRCLTMFGLDKIAKIEKDIINLQLMIDKKPNRPDKDIYERLVDLETKMAKLYTMLLTETPYGKPKLTKFGKMFGGQARSHL